MYIADYVHVNISSFAVLGIKLPGRKSRQDPVGSCILYTILHRILAGS